jgi:hypothetical protein
MIGIFVSGGIAEETRSGGSGPENHGTGVSAGPVDLDVAPRIR